METVWYKLLIYNYPAFAGSRWQSFGVTACAPIGAQIIVRALAPGGTAELLGTRRGIAATKVAGMRFIAAQRLKDKSTNAVERVLARKELLGSCWIFSGNEW